MTCLTSFDFLGFIPPSFFPSLLPLSSPPVHPGAQRGPTGDDDHSISITRQAFLPLPYPSHPRLLSLSRSPRCLCFLHPSSLQRVSPSTHFLSNINIPRLPGLKGRNRPQSEGRKKDGHSVCWGQRTLGVDGRWAFKSSGDDPPQGAALFETPDPARLVKRDMSTDGGSSIPLMRCFISDIRRSHLPLL